MHLHWTNVKANISFYLFQYLILNNAFNFLRNHLKMISLPFAQFKQESIPIQCIPQCLPTVPSTIWPLRGDMGPEIPYRPNLWDHTPHSRDMGPEISYPHGRNVGLIRKWHHMNRMTDRHLWKHNLPTITLSGDNKPLYSRTYLYRVTGPSLCRTEDHSFRSIYYVGTNTTRRHRRWQFVSVYCWFTCRYKESQLE